MAEGLVKWFNKRMGYGFIDTGEGHDLFVHYSSIVSEGYKSLREGERVSFTEEEGAKGPQATQVKRILRQLSSSNHLEEERNDES